MILSSYFVWSNKKIFGKKLMCFFKEKKEREIQYFDQFWSWRDFFYKLETNFSFSKTKSICIFGLLQSIYRVSLPIGHMNLGSFLIHYFYSTEQLFF